MEGTFDIPLPAGLGTRGFQPTAAPAPAEVPTFAQQSEGAFGSADLPAVVQPGEYHPGYAKHIVDWFDKPKKREVVDTVVFKSGAESERIRYVPNPPPLFSEYARSIGVTTRTLKRWGREHTEFRDALETCQEIFEEFLVENGLEGGYSAVAFKFVAVNKTRMRDKSETQVKKVDINKALDQIAAGAIAPGGLLPGGDEEANDDGYSF
jgi:hypothetical protein